MPTGITFTCLCCLQHGLGNLFMSLGHLFEQFVVFGQLGSQKFLLFWLDCYKGRCIWEIYKRNEVEKVCKGNGKMKAPVNCKGHCITDG